MNSIIPERKAVSLTKLKKILFYASIIISLVVIPLMILSFLDIGGIPMFVTFIIFLSVFCLVILALIVIDVFRIYSNKKQKS